MIGFRDDESTEVLAEAVPQPTSGEQPPASAEAKAPRHRWALYVAGGAALLSVGGLVGATFVQSPEEQRASAQAPPRSVLTAVVEQRRLASTLVTRGSVGPERQVEATPASAQGAAVTVVTAVRTKEGAKVKPGDVVVTVSGRPLLVLPGALPAYRDLKPGEEGDDVAQLQTALKSLGHYHSGDRKGYFGGSTKAAVRRLYDAVGFQIPDTGGEDDPGNRTALRAADDAVAAAQTALNALGGTQPAAAPGQPSIADQRKAARAALNRAKGDRAELIARTGPMVPMSEVIFLTAFPATVSKLGAKVGIPVEAPLITFATGRLTVTIKLQPEQVSLVRAGMPVELLSEALGRKAAGTVSSVGKLTTDQPDRTTEANGQAGQAGQPYIPVTVLPKKPLDSAWNAADLRVTITSAQTPGDVLVVPISAVSASADGATTVTVQDADGRERRVPVKPGVSGDGFIAIAPAGDDPLAAGDRVVVGQ
jgi:peptidoglycan hydrolase-like protein with peptidoglycan-binding domain